MSHFDSCLVKSLEHTSSEQGPSSSQPSPPSKKFRSSVASVPPAKKLSQGASTELLKGEAPFLVTFIYCLQRHSDTQTLRHSDTQTPDLTYLLTHAHTHTHSVLSPLLLLPCIFSSFFPTVPLPLFSLSLAFFAQPSACFVTVLPIQHHRPSLWYPHVCIALHVFSISPTQLLSVADPKLFLLVIGGR